MFADERRDISGSEHLCISIKWINSEYTVYEDIHVHVVALARVKVTDVGTCTLTSTIKDALIRYGLRLDQC